MIASRSVGLAMYVVIHIINAMIASWNNPSDQIIVWCEVNMIFQQGWPPLYSREQDYFFQKLINCMKYVCWMQNRFQLNLLIIMSNLISYWPSTLHQDSICHWILRQTLGKDPFWLSLNTRYTSVVWLHIVQNSRRGKTSVCMLFILAHLLHRMPNCFLAHLHMVHTCLISLKYSQHDRSKCTL